MTEAATPESVAAIDRPLGLLGDERLARRAANGDRRAFAAIYRRYQDDLYRFSLTIVGNSHDAQDALQNTMVQALRALPGEEREVKLKPWLYRVARNEAINVIRRRREESELDPDQIVSGEEVSASVETRERLRGLLADLRELPERQRTALVMRELAGLEFAEIGTVLDTSPAVARQTLYEARLGLRRMESGREMTCEEAKEEISRADGRGLRRRDIRAHLRGCQDCRRFRDSIAERRRDFAAIAPLPAVASAGLLHAVLGGTGGTGGGALASAGTAGTAGTVGTIAGKAAATSAVAKSLAAVALVAAGVATADRTGLIETPIPGGHQASGSATREAGESSGSSTNSGSDAGLSGAESQGGTKPGGPAASGSSGGVNGGKATEGPGGKPGEDGPGASGELPPASSHGQSTAASHGGGRSNAHSHGGGHSHSGAGGKSGAHGNGHPHTGSTKHPHPAHPIHPAHGGPGAPSHPVHPATPQVPPAGEAPDNQPQAPLQPPKQSSNQGGAASGERPTS